ncbi:non-structural protein NS4A [Legionella steelei]|nr:non-structural protein NS4A [Legionella steelei]
MSKTMNLYAATVEVSPIKENVAQTTSSYFTSVPLYVQVLSITIGIVFLFIAFYMLRSKEEEQRRIQDQFMFYLIIGLLFVFLPFLLEYLF